MLYSMTGYGRAEQTIGSRSYLIEVRSLNGKQFDLRLNIPAILKPYEFDIRTALAEGLGRGTVECVVTVKENGASKPVSINTALAKAYFTPVRELAEDLHLGTENILSTLLKLPDVVVPANEILSKEDYGAFALVLKDAIDKINAHRRNEGAVLEKDLVGRIENIEKLEPEIASHEVLRRGKIKDGLVKLLNEYVGNDKYDPNRLEQELIYYIEKIDIHEEQVRLKNHCNYFHAILQEPGNAKGKKLAFILQEMGREINTTGSKAYDSEIQKTVVLMKDELEKAKEQILNVL